MENKAANKQVLVILGSPRKKGNSSALAAHISRGAESAGAEVETLFLQDLKISPCRGCDTCKKNDSKGCAINDDMQEIYEKLIKADAWVTASPVYWFTMSAQTKIFMDRCYALPAYAKNPFAGKFFTRVYESRLGDDDPNACYFAGRRDQTITVFFLNGVKTPRLEEKTGWNIEGVEWKVVIDVGAKAMDWRALQKLNVSFLGPIFIWFVVLLVMQVRL